VTLRRCASLGAVAAAVGDSLRRHGIRGVVTGGSCASLHSDGVYQSQDIDIVLSGLVTQEALDRSLASVGFTRHGDRYVRADSPFFVEFPRGPLAVGGDERIRAVELAFGRARFLALSPTDSCRDRLAQFFHWKDRQSLSVAVLVAARRRVNLRRIRAWSAAEGFSTEYLEFLRDLKAVRRRQAGRDRP
jgi:hypothetical protein